MVHGMHPTSSQDVISMIHFVHVINLLWIPCRGRFALLPEMTGLRTSGNYTLILNVSKPDKQVQIP